LFQVSEPLLEIKEGMKARFSRTNKTGGKTNKQGDGKYGTTTKHWQRL